MYIIMQISKKIKAKASITITTINAIISDEDSSLKILSNLRFDMLTSTDAVFCYHIVMEIIKEMRHMWSWKLF